MKYTLTHHHKKKYAYLKIGLFLFCSCFASALLAQEETTKEPHKIGLSVGVSSGLHAIFGADLAATILPNLGIRVGYNYLKTSKDGYETSLKRLGVNNSTTPFILDTEVNLNTTQLWLEFMPGSARLFRIQAGFAIALDNKTDVKARYGETFYFNDFAVEPEDLGELTIRYESNKILPYLGMGFGHAVPKKLLTFSMEIGAYYRGKPKISLVGTQLFEPNNDNNNGAAISENAGKYKIHPVLAFRLGVRLK